jgi:6-phosphogluconolactonase (cycloisomerase 2 family)
MQDLTNSAHWVSSSDTVAPVDQHGLVTGETVGSVTITATQGGQLGTATVNVTSAVLVSITVDPSSPTIIAGGIKLLKAIGTFSDGSIQDLTTSASWSSSDPLIATVESMKGIDSGLVTGESAGNVKVTGKQDGISGTAAVTVTSPPEFAYVTNDTDNTVSAFTVDPTAGTLTPITGSPFPNPGSGAASVTADPSGKFLYTANQFGSTGNTVTAYSITPSGSSKGGLTPVGSPFPSGAGAFSVAVDPSGQFAYVGNVGNNTISGFKIDPGTGALTPVPTSPFSALPATGAQGVAVNPNDKFLYVADSGTNQVSFYPFDSTTGVLNLAGRLLFGPPASNPINDPVSVTLDPLGRFAYTANNTLPGAGSGPGNVSVYTIDSSTGALTWVENTGNIGIPGAGPAMVAVDSKGKFAYVAGGGLATAFTINRTTGVLTPTVPPTFPAGSNTLSVAVDPSGKFVYVANHGSFGGGTTPGGVSAYSMNPATGVLTEITGSPFPLPKGPTSITVVAVP